MCRVLKRFPPKRQMVLHFNSPVGGGPWALCPVIAKVASQWLGALRDLVGPFVAQSLAPHQERTEGSSHYRVEIRPARQRAWQIGRLIVTHCSAMGKVI